uniref:glycerophosphodiester phosphodiesterase n=1 Tax=Ekhidna sp. TaxID=2608089 RepID=UPI0032EBA8BA
MTIDIQGHRGARGLAPENSIPAFLMAAEMGVNTLELDLVVSKDHQLVVSHEPFFSPDFCLRPDGNRIPADSIINIYQMEYAEIKKFDCGSIGNPRFPDQEKMSVYKPLLSEVLDQVKEAGFDSIRYNIELKTQLETDSIFHPTPDIFSELVVSLLKEKNLLDRVTIQSFDFRTLRYIRANYPEIQLAALIENELSWKDNIGQLSFTPEIYSSYYQLLSQDIVKEIQTAGMRVVPWTVNDSAEMKKLIAWGVDGIITDYPDRALKVIKRK